MSVHNGDPDEDASLALALQLQEQFDHEQELFLPSYIQYCESFPSISSEHIIIGGDNQVISRFGPSHRRFPRYRQIRTIRFIPSVPQPDIDVDHMNHEQLLELCERIGDAPQAGMSPEDISRLPTYTYHAKPTEGTTSPSHPTSSDSDNNKCLICLSDFAEGDKLTTLPCIHTFHTDCISEWLRRKHSCPVCKETV